MDARGSASIAIVMAILLVLAGATIYFYALTRANLEVQLVGVPDQLFYGDDIKGKVIIKNKGPADAKSTRLDLLIEMGSRGEPRDWPLGDIRANDEAFREFSIPTILGDAKFAVLLTSVSIKVTVKADNGQGETNKQLTLKNPSVGLEDCELPGWSVLAQKYVLRIGDYQFKSLRARYEGKEPEQIKLAIGVKLKAAYLKHFNVTASTAKLETYDSQIIWILGEKTVETTLRSWEPDLSTTRFRITTDAKGTIIDLEAVVFWVRSPSQYVFLPATKTLTIEIQGQ